jgi:chromosome partitioning protein
MKIITFSSIKGGTGKSSLTILTANYTAAAGHRVLVIDLDLQNSATSYYLDESELAERHNVARALQTGDLTQQIVPTNYMGIDLVASSFDLVAMRNTPVGRLKEILPQVAPIYDFVFVDTAPTYDNLVLNGLLAADRIFMPAAFSQFDYKGAGFYKSQLARDTDQIEKWQILFNFYRAPRSSNPESLRNQYEALFRNTFEGQIAPVAIPEAAAVRRSIDTGEKVTESHGKAVLHKAIGDLAALCGVSRQAGRF